VVVALAFMGALAPRLVFGEDPGPAPATPNGIAVVYKDPLTANLFIGNPPLVLNEKVLGVPPTPGLGAFSLLIGFDPDVVSIDIQEGPFLRSTGRATQCSTSVLLETQISFACTSTGAADGPSGGGILAYITVSPLPNLDVLIRPTTDNGVIVRIDDLASGTTLADIHGGSIPILTVLDSVIAVRRLEGDLNGDCIVNIVDEQLISDRFGYFFGSLLYSFFFDLEPSLGDGDIDVKDLQFVFGRDGSTCDNPNPPQPSPTPEQTPPTPPTLTPTPIASATPTPPPATPTRTSTPTPGPSSTPTATVTPGPSATPTVTVTPGPSATPTVSPTPGPSLTPTPAVSATPTLVATSTPLPTSTAVGPSPTQRAAAPVATSTVGAATPTSTPSRVSQVLGQASPTPVSQVRVLPPSGEGGIGPAQGYQALIAIAALLLALLGLRLASRVTRPE